MNAYVVTHWHASNTPDRDGNFIHIAGRKSGLVDYLLTLLKLNARVLLKVSDGGLTFAESSLFADRNVNTPLAKVTSTIYGWKRPFWEAVFMSFLAYILIAGISVALLMVMLSEESHSPLIFIALLGLAALVSVAVGVVYFRLNRVLTLGVVTECGETYWLRLKRSLIENVKLDQPLAEAASKVIDSLVMARCAGTQSANFGSVAPVVQIRPASPVPVPASAPTPPAPAPPSAASKGTRRVGPLNTASSPAPTPTPTASSGPRATCSYCATRVAFPPEGVGMEVPCPTCGKPLLLVPS